MRTLVVRCFRALFIALALCAVCTGSAVRAEVLNSPSSAAVCTKTTSVSKNSKCPSSNAGRTGEHGETKAGNGDNGAEGSSVAITSAERLLQDAVFWFFVGLACGLICYRVMRFASQKLRKDLFRVEWVWIGVACIGALGHAVAVGTKVGAQWEPLFDTTTLLWLGAAAAGLLYPRISEVTLGSLGVKLTDVADEANELVVSAFAISDKWATRLNGALADLPAQSATDVMQKVTGFLSEAAKDAIDWLGKDGESRRLAFWLYDRTSDQIGFFLSNEITPTNSPAICRHVFQSGVGLVGQALLAREPINLENAKNAFGFVRIPGDRTKYCGMLLVAIKNGNEPLGVIAVNRSLQEPFPQDAVGLISALASVTGTLLGEPTIRKKLGIP